MDSERYQRVKALFFEASRRSGAERSSYLESACTGDPTLGEDVEGLLAAGAAPRGFLESPAIDDEGFRAVLAESLAWPGEDDDLPTWIGRYRVIRCIGEGGMGVTVRPTPCANRARRSGSRGERPAASLVV